MNYHEAESKLIEQIARQNELELLLNEELKIKKKISNVKRRIKDNHKGFLNAQSYLKNRSKFIKNLENKYSHLKYISGYRTRSGKYRNINFKVWVQDRKTKIRFWTYSSQLRKPNYQGNILFVHRSHVLKEDLSVYDALIVKYRKEQKQKLKPILFYPCKVCGTVFESKWGQQCCSNECSRKRKNRLREKKRSIRTKRAKANGKYDNSITLEKVFKRDKGVCYLCGRHLSLKTYYNDPSAPTIEHVIPIIKGGTHTWDNVRLACRKCNNRKGTKLSMKYIEKAS